MNLRDLQYLVAAAEHLHFGKAAETCHVSQPTLSMQLKKMEETLNVRLFERTNKQVMLTQAGAQIVVRAKRILAETDQIRHIADMFHDPAAGDMRMGVFPTLAPYLLPLLVPELKQEMPKLNLLLVEEKTPDILKQLEEGVLDCALLAMPAGNDDLACAKLFKEPFLLAVPVAHPLASRKQVTIEDLKGQTMLLLDEGHCLREQALEVCHKIGIGEAQNFRATSLETLRHMVAAGSAVTLMPQLAVTKNDPLIRYISFKMPPARTIGLYWRRSSAREALFMQLSEVVRRVIKPLF
jgi:LysR family transcriptional regulator, hydrogen peroxide-inducible genes activator